MFMQVHFLRSAPPGNLNRDDAGRPKTCIFGGVTRGRVSSQCIKRNIRKSQEFGEKFGGSLAIRTKSLPEIVAKELKKINGYPSEDVKGVMNALAGKFKAEKDGSKDDSEDGSSKKSPKKDEIGLTSQLVFFPQSFARKTAELINGFRANEEDAYNEYIKDKVKSKPKTDRDKETKKAVEKLEKDISEASKTLAVDIALFGRMTTSDLVVDTEAACQVAHAVSTHETIIESDYFTAMDDLKTEAGAGHIGSGDDATLYNSSVYYMYLNLDIGALEKHLELKDPGESADIAGTLVEAAAKSNPTGKQNSFAAHGVPELIVVEMSKKKLPISYANAFLEPAEGGLGQNLMTKSAEMLKHYIESVGTAYMPDCMKRIHLAVGAAASFELADSKPFASIDELARGVADLAVSLNAEE